jgi:phage terminase small subunit
LPQQALFVAAYVSGGCSDAAAAARAAGYYPDYGRRLKELPHVKAAIQRTYEGMTIGLTAWEALLPRAQMRLLELVECENPRVALAACIEVLNRGLGKAVAHVQATVEVEEDNIDTPTMRYAIALAITQNIGLPEAMERAQKDPDAVLEFVRSNQANQ